MRNPLYGETLLILTEYTSEEKVDKERYEMGLSFRIK